MEREHILVGFIPLVVLHKDNCKDRLVWTEHDVNDVVHVSEDPLLLKFLRNFVPIGQISAAMFVL